MTAPKGRLTARGKIVYAFSRLPDEAFGYFCGMMLNTAHTAGGFQHDSRAAIEALGPLIDAYFKAKTAADAAAAKKQS